MLRFWRRSKGRFVCEATMSWIKGVADWTENNTAFVSVPFTWKLQDAYQRCIWYKAQGYRVRAGGPAVSLMPDFLADVAEIGGEVNALPYHNPDATFTSRGCIRRCPFCAVPKIEGELRELQTWEPKPVVCDNNLLACSKKHFNKVVDSLKEIKEVDFNQGLDSRLLTPYHAGRLGELDLLCLRLAWDNVKYEQPFMDAVTILDNAGFKRDMICVYVLIGFTDTPEDARYRLETLVKMNILPFAMRFHPLDSMRFHGYIGPHWTEDELIRFTRYYSRIKHLGWIPFDDYDPHKLGRKAPPEQATLI